MSGFTSAIPQQPQITGNTTIVNPLDANGNLKVDLETDSTGYLNQIANRIIYSGALTTAPLGANATFVGQFINRPNGSSQSGTVKAFAISDQDFTLYIDYSIDGSTIDYSIEATSATISSPYVAGAYGSQFAKIVDEFSDVNTRIRIVNGATAQTYLRSQIIWEDS